MFLTRLTGFINTHEKYVKLHHKCISKDGKKEIVAKHIVVLLLF